MNETPYKTLYKLNSNGSTQQWSICFDDKSHWSVSGKLGGKMIVASPTLVTAKVNRTLTEQILSEVESAINKKRDKKYVEDVKDIHSAEDMLCGFGAMLAHSYEKQKSKIKYPCIVQPKLDGVRCLSTTRGFYSRGRKEFSSCQHIRKELEAFFEGSPQARLDGEFYSHEYKEDFEKICKSVKKTAEKATPADLEFQKKVQLHLYDTPRIASLVETDSFQKRQAELAKTFKNYKYIVIVETVVVNNEEEMLKCKERWIQDGYEGIMLRNIDSPYEGKRSYNLQKFKDFIDEEFEIIGVNEGNGKLAGHAGSFTFKNPNGKSFDAKMIGSISRLKDLYENQSKAMGKMATIRYQNLSSDGVPRFPVCRGIRDYE